jgi:hypothetical protein
MSESSSKTLSPSPMASKMQTQATASIPPPLEQEQHVSVSQPVDALAGQPTLIDFLHTVPAPLVALLARLASPLSPLRHAAQILSWKSSWVDSWLLLAAWWILVLFADCALRLVLFCSYIIAG